MSTLEKLDETREKLPEAIGEIARIVIDNPVQFAAIGAGSWVTASILMNLVKPRGIVGCASTGFIAYLASLFIMTEAKKRGLLVIRVRDENGCLVPLKDLTAKLASDAPGKV